MIRQTCDGSDVENQDDDIVSNTEEGAIWRVCGIEKRGMLGVSFQGCLRKT
jgi:hypothetical protein